MKYIRIVLILAMIISTLGYNVVYAGDDYTKPGEILEIGRNWIKTGEEESKNGIQMFNNYNSLNDLSGILMGIGIFVVIGSGMILGARYMLATPNQKANLNKTLIVYIVGSILILGALGIWKLVISILETSVS